MYAGEFDTFRGRLPSNASTNTKAKILGGSPTSDVNTTERAPFINPNSFTLSEQSFSWMIYSSFLDAFIQTSIFLQFALDLIKLNLNTDVLYADHQLFLIFNIALWSLLLLYETIVLLIMGYKKYYRTGEEQTDQRSQVSIKQLLLCMLGTMLAMTSVVLSLKLQYYYGIFILAVIIYCTPKLLQPCRRTGETAALAQRLLFFILCLELVGTCVPSVNFFVYSSDKPSTIGYTMGMMMSFVAIIVIFYGHYDRHEFTEILERGDGLGTDVEMSDSSAREVFTPEAGGSRVHMVL